MRTTAYRNLSICLAALLFSVVLLAACDGAALPDVSSEALDARPPVTLAPSAAVRVTSLTLIDVATGRALPGYDPIPEGAALDLADLPAVSVRADTEPSRVGSVTFELNGKDVRTENYLPYAIAGDINRTTYNSWPLPAPGRHTLSVTPYTAPQRGGTAGEALSLAFTVVRGAPSPETGVAWTTFTPSANTRIVYVSNAGDDAAARAYTSSEVGSDPFAPGSAVKPYKTLSAALAQTRDGYPDWVLLKRGDTWRGTDGLKLKSGRSSTERFLIGAYGAASARPLIDTGAGRGIFQNDALRHAALVGIDFYASERDPTSPNFSRANINSEAYGLSYLAKGGVTNLLIEGCRLRYFADNAFQASRTGEGKMSGLTLRGNVINDTYRGNANATGTFFYKVDNLLLEGNVFDHNGWITQGVPPSTDRTGGKATMFNHNIYLSGGNNVTIRNNLFLRGSSMGIKLRSDVPGGMKNVTIEDNLFVEGEIGISAGGNTDEPERFENITVKDNVFLHIGRTQPTGRLLAWHLDVQDWNKGLVEGNLFAFQEKPVNTVTYAVKLARTRDVKVRGNVVYDLSSNQPLVQLEEAGAGNVFTNNRVQSPGQVATLISLEDAADYALSNNKYYGKTERNRWFKYGGFVSPERWRELAGETPSLTQVAFPDAGRSLGAYTAAQGGQRSFGAFLTTVRTQTPQAWQPAFEAARINRYFREGFGLK